MPKHRYTRPFLPVLLAALATIIAGAAFGLAPYAVTSLKRPELSLWNLTDPPTAICVTAQAVIGIVVMETLIVPVIIYPLWRNIDRAIIAPRVKAADAARHGMQWAEWSPWRR